MTTGHFPSKASLVPGVLQPSQVVWDLKRVERAHGENKVNGTKLSRGINFGECCPAIIQRHSLQRGSAGKAEQCSCQDGAGPFAVLQLKPITWKKRTSVAGLSRQGQILP